MLNQMVSPREAIAILPRAVLHGAILVDRVVDTGLVPLEVSGAGEGLSAVFTRIGFG
jgi:hypothetical protein